MSWYNPKSWFITRDTISALHRLLSREIQSASASNLKEMAQINLELLNLADQVKAFEVGIQISLEKLHAELDETREIVKALVKRPQPEPVTKILEALFSSLDGARQEIGKKMGEVRADFGGLTRLQMSNTNIAAETLQVLKKAVNPFDKPR